MLPVLQINANKPDLPWLEHQILAFFIAVSVIAPFFFFFTMNWVIAYNWDSLVNLYTKDVQKVTHKYLLTQHVYLFIYFLNAMSLRYIGDYDFQQIPFLYYL